ncbi:asparagine synthase (glutamine-hydrolyzing) [Lignipirellula cremea]|uniref:asparagine synthase (glutamine-hydrolyzing) n=1 Tax=Lignipirellula cremea TaxID=2528010 RepID=A0A518DR34_9BACT|nr:asparagine synthase (glutamine-hydrolyzing) [Lignipirellula cremea]QDU94282.1 Asparagine synthetase [glutamine-hydrolyzing] 1 [Lignipirellula cremea]
MCGIAGAIWSDPAFAVEEEILQRMTDLLRHRGPDAEGHYRSDYRLRPPYDAMPGVALGHRRLSIIDLAGGAQPLANEDDTVWVVFNGEIYNFPELRNRLEGAGHRFRTHSDTETIVHLYEDEGPACFEHLNGMFSIAIWDQNKRRLVLGRDRLGQKPLFYRPEAQRLSFASELKSLLAIPGAPRELDPNAVDEYLCYQYVPHPQCIFRGYRKLQPGHYAVFQDGVLTVEPYWRPDFQHEQHIRAADAVPQLQELLRSSVKMRMQADVPLGAFLSGGVDSSLIVALMQQQSDRPVKTFSIGFPQAAFDETKYARQVAQHLGAEHHEFQVTPDGVSILPQLVWHYDEPMADSSAIPTWYVSEQTRQHVTVALTGDGGDELFAGYQRYRAVGLAGMLDRAGVSRLLGARIWQRMPSSGQQKSRLRQLKRFSEALSQSPQRRYLDWVSIFQESRRAELYTDAFTAKLADSDPLDFLAAAWSRADGRDPITAASLADLTTYLPCDLMTKVDIASMAQGLECRQPFLDYRLVEFAASLPIGLKYQRGRGKLLLRQAFGDLLPENIWQRKKMGFGVPLDHWFRHELKEMAYDTLLDEQTRQRGIFRPESVSNLLEEHQSGRFDHSLRLWSLLLLELWLREWMP